MKIVVLIGVAALPLICALTMWARFLFLREAKAFRTRANQIQEGYEDRDPAVTNLYGNRSTADEAAARCDRMAAEETAKARTAAFVAAIAGALGLLTLGLMAL